MTFSRPPLDASLRMRAVGRRPAIARRLGSLGLAAALALWAGGALAGGVEDFYAGKRIVFIIGSGEAGGYDLYARLIAQYLGKHIPGRPVVTPQNMPGASSIRAAEYIYNVAPRDGTVLAMFQSTFVLDKVVDPALRFRSEQFTWLGRANAMTAVGVVSRASPPHTIESAKKTETTMAAIGPTGTAATIPWALNRAIGTKFKVVLGYESTAKTALAMDSGETDGGGSTSWDFVVTRPDWRAHKTADILYTIDIDRLRDEPDVPTVAELVTDLKDKEAIKLIASTSTIGRSVVSTPGVPAERTAALRAAFEATLADPEFLADAKRLNFDIAPMTGEAMQRIVAQVAQEPEDIVARMKALSARPD